MATYTFHKQSTTNLLLICLALNEKFDVDEHFTKLMHGNYILWEQF